MNERVKQEERERNISHVVVLCRWQTHEKQEEKKAIRARILIPINTVKKFVRSFDTHAMHAHGPIAGNIRVSLNLAMRCATLIRI